MPWTIISLMFVPSNDDGFDPTDTSVLFDFGSESLQHARPAAVDVPANLFAALGAQLLELAVFKLNARRVSAFRDERDLNLGPDSCWVSIGCQCPRS